MKFVKLSHCVYYCNYHIAITTKYKHEWLNEGIFAYLQIKFVEIRKHHPLINFKTVNYDKKQSDHIHFLVSIPPYFKTFGCTIPAPPISSQPSLQSLHFSFSCLPAGRFTFPVPLHTPQETSTSNDGSVN